MPPAVAAQQQPSQQQQQQQRRSAAARHGAIKATPVERVAGLAFFAFTLMQVTFFIVDSDLSASGLVLLSPLQVSAANLARQFPAAFHYIDDVLVPGAWVREALSPYLKCQFKTSWKGPCEQQRAHLSDLSYVRNGTNLPLLVELLDSEGIGAQQYIVYGCSMIVLSALFSLYYSVKTAVVGFILLGYGIYAGNHIPLPPIVMVAFLCVYAGFNLAEARGGASVKQLKQRAAAGKGSGAAAASGQKPPQRGSSSKGGSGSSSARKQRGRA